MRKKFHLRRHDGYSVDELEMDRLNKHLQAGIALGVPMTVELNAYGAAVLTADLAPAVAEPRT